MKIKIPRKEIVKHNPCPGGMEWFDKLKSEMGVPKNKVLVIDWTPELMLKLLCGEGKAYVRWATDRNIVPLLSLYRANLYGANLQGAYLECADLYCANLSGAYLNGANLEGANLEGANLIGANFRGADLEGANLSGADLSGADLARAYLRGADLERAYYPTGPVPEGWRRTETGHLTRA